MIKNLAMLASIWLLHLSPTLCSRITLDDRSRHREIAGHSVLKVLDQNNTGQHVGGTAAIFQDRAGDYWLASYSKLRRYSEPRNKWTMFPSDFHGTLPYYAVRYICQTKDGTLWFGGDSNGLSPFTSVTAFQADTWRLLEGTIRVGLRTIDFKSKIYACFPGRPGSVWFVFSDQGEPYVTAFDGEEWLSPINVPFYIGVGVFSGFEDGRGQLWMENDLNIWKLERGKGLWKKSLKPKQLSLIHHIFEDREGEMWFADTQSQVARYDADTNTWTYYRLTDYLPAYAKRPNKLLEPYGLDLMVSAAAIYEDRSGKLFFGTNRGLLIFIKAQGRWEFCTLNPADPMAITTIFEDKSERVWIATEKDIVIIAP